MIRVSLRRPKPNPIKKSAAATQVAILTKQDLRGARIKQIYVNLFAAYVGASAITRVWWYMVSYKRRQNYQSSYENHDLVKDYGRMKKAGIFKGIPDAK